MAFVVKDCGCPGEHSVFVEAAAKLPEKFWREPLLSHGLAATAGPSTQRGTEADCSAVAPAPTCIWGDVRSCYETVRDLSKGGFCEGVRVARPLRGGELVAVKSIKLSGMTSSQVAEARREVHLHAGLQHPHVAKLQQVFQNHAELALVMELLDGGDALDLVQRVGRLSEQRTATLIKQTLRALEYIHGQGLMHLDVKPENLVFTNRECTTLKLVDFGLSRRCDEQRKACRGTERYMAPEVKRGTSYDTKADMWSLGVVLHVFLTARFPSAHTALAANSQALFNFATCLAPVSAGAKDFLKSLLLVDPSARLDATSALDNPWLVVNGIEACSALPSAGASAVGSRSSCASPSDNALAYSFLWRLGQSALALCSNF